MKNLVLMLNLLLCFVCFGACKPNSQTQTVSNPVAPLPPTSDTIVIEEMMPEWDVYLEDFPSQNKTRETSQMCWAMSACNVLYYHEWVDSTQGCVDWMLAEYGNEGYPPSFAARDYLNANYPDQWEMPKAFYGTPSGVLDFMLNELDAGYGVVLVIGDINDGPSHAINVYGYREDSTTVTMLVRDGNDGISPWPPTREIIIDKNTTEITGTYHRYYLGRSFSITSAR